MKQTDFDGKFTYSDIIAIRKSASPSDLKVYLNTADVLMVRYKADTSFSGDVNVYDSNGRKIKSLIVNFLPGENIFDLSLDNLSSGTYFLSFINENNSQSSIKFFRN